MEGPRRGRRNRPAGRQTAPPPSQKLLLQHQQNRKRESALEYRLKKRVDIMDLGIHYLLVLYLLKEGCGKLFFKSYFNVLKFFFSTCPLDKTGEEQTFKGKKHFCRFQGPTES